MEIIHESLPAPAHRLEEVMTKVLLKILIVLSILIAQNAFADCSKTTLNKSDEIYEGFLCKLISKQGTKDIKNLCFIRAQSTNDPDQVYKYTQMKTLVIGESGTRSSFLTFKWHHKKIHLYQR
jgi:hypothetical protein